MKSVTFEEWLESMKSDNELNYYGTQEKALWKRIYEAGRKSTNEEIKILKQDCKNLVNINNNQTEIMKSKDIEIKNLRINLTHPDYRPEIQNGKM